MSVSLPAAGFSQTSLISILSRCTDVAAATPRGCEQPSGASHPPPHHYIDLRALTGSHRPPPLSVQSQLTKTLLQWSPFTLQFVFFPPSSSSLGLVPLAAEPFGSAGSARTQGQTHLVARAFQTKPVSMVTTFPLLALLFMAAEHIMRLQSLIPSPAVPASSGYSPFLLPPSPHYFLSACPNFCASNHDSYHF